MPELWRAALGAGREPSTDQLTAIVAPITGRHVVNAGAGTGKTSTLALRTAYLVETGLVAANEIVVVTFTKKAAAEVGARIADTIERIATSDDSRRAPGHGVTCTTIHGLAAHIVREFAFDSGARGPLRAISDGEAYSLFHESFRALLDGRLDVETDAFPIAEVDVTSLERDLAKLALRLKNHAIAPADFVARALAQADAFACQSWGQLWTAGKAGNRTDRLPSEPVTSADLATEVARERANIHVVGALLCDFDRRLAERGAATYGDLIAHATRLLRCSPGIVTQLRRRWRYVLLDESQDTSALQLSFIRTLCGAPDESDAIGMMPVGDTRQAIYGFNGADESVMEDLEREAQMVHPLVRNRRSPQEIVDAAHAVLAAAGVVDDATPRLQADLGRAGLACVRVQEFVADGGQSKEHVALESAAIAREIARLIEHEGASPADIAILLRRRTHAATYVRALNERGIVAALDRRSGLFAADEVRDALAWMNLLLDLRDVESAVRVLQSAMCGLSDATMIELAARRDWLDDVLTNRVGDVVDADTRARLDRFRELVTQLLPAVAFPLAAAVGFMLETLPLAAAYVRLGQTIGAQAILNLRGLQELAREFAAERADADLHAFVADITRRIAYDDEPPEPELEFEGVRVLTIHQAKGLEWPFVFVACATTFQYAVNDPSDIVVRYDLESGALALKNDIDGRETFRWMTSTREHDPATGQRLAHQPRKAARQREAARVFYVALTRARRRVYVTVPGPRAASYVGAIRQWADAQDPGSDLRFDIAAAPAPATATATATATAAAAAAMESPRAERETGRDVVERIRRCVDTATTIRPRVSFTALAAFATCPRLARFRYRLLLPDLRNRSARFVAGDNRPEPPALQNAARLGSLTHRALELWGAARIAATTLPLADAFAAATLDFVDAAAADIEEARARTHRAVEALAGYTLIAVEAPFALVVAGVTIEGSIDLIARDPAGALVVIDYKTGQGDDADYALQLSLYRHAVEERYPHEQVTAAILRLTAYAGTLSYPGPLAADEIDRVVRQAGSFESDAPKVGSWCGTCAYRGSPCNAPLEKAS